MAWHASRSKTMMMTPRQRFITALERRSGPGRVPHFELVFFLTMQVLDKVHPLHRNYGQWFQMSQREQSAHRRDIAQMYIDIARRFEHDAIFLHPNPNEEQEVIRLIDEVRNLSGDRYYLMLHGDPTLAIPEGSGMESLSYRMMDEPERVEREAAEQVDQFIRRAEVLQKHGGIDGFTLCSDYCFNTGTFMSLDWFDRFVTPYLHRIIKAYRDMGFYVIKHTDGNIMPILDRLVPDDPNARPHALHSLDPQGGVDIARIVSLVGDRVALCGNVNCGLLQTGTEEACIESARYALKQGMKAPGYIFSTSNCVYTGMPLERYELVIDVWRKEGCRKCN
jgi:Uroporphyrinogen decarboxylase (URO-D)